ncbi:MULTISPECIES: IS66 family insertion sequence element accessory protein TnpB [Dyadobacter]|jgi:transposase
MFGLGSSHQYFLYRGSCDMRKGFDGLCGIVDSELGRVATSGEVFIFVNRRRTQLKMLRWEPGGFILYHKRLESGTFPIPKKVSSGSIFWADLVLMIEGIQILKSRRRKRFNLQQ